MTNVSLISNDEEKIKIFYETCFDFNLLVSKVHPSLEEKYFDTYFENCDYLFLDENISNDDKILSMFLNEVKTKIFTKKITFCFSFSERPDYVNTFHKMVKKFNLPIEEKALFKEKFKTLLKNEIGVQTVSSYEKLMLTKSKDKETNSCFELSFRKQKAIEDTTMNGVDVIFGSLGTINLTKEIIEDVFLTKEKLSSPIFIILHFSNIHSIFEKFYQKINTASKENAVLLGKGVLKTPLENKIYLLQPSYTFNIKDQNIIVEEKKEKSTWEPSCDMTMGTLTAYFNLSKLNFYVLGGIGEDSLKTSIFLNSRFTTTYLLKDLFCDAATDICEKIKFNIDKYNEVNKYELIQLLRRKTI
jgi:hypothetical protein